MEPFLAAGFQPGQQAAERPLLGDGEGSRMLRQPGPQHGALVNVTVSTEEEGFLLRIKNFWVIRVGFI